MLPPPNLRDFNVQKVWFAPKGTQDEDSRAVYREPSQLRTIFGGNTDAKIVAGGVGFKIVSAVLAVTPFMQRGFCHGRQLALNVVDLDAYLRLYNSCGNFSDPCSRIGELPCLALYDFCNAFPTLVHEWLFMVLKMYNFPIELQWIIWWLYQDITAYSSGTGNGSFLFYVLGGVKTGCPLSSLLFLLGINPIVDLFILISDGPKLSTTRVCADDFGSALKMLKSLKRQASIFRMCSKVSGLQLKPVKCVLVFTGIELTNSIIFAIRNWLKKHIPEFADFKIQSSGKYLGWYLGKNSVKLSFEAPLAKYQSRVSEVVQGKAPISASIVRYNQRCIPCISYVSQFANPCRQDYDLQAIEHTAVHRVFRMPPQAMSRNLMHSSGFCTEVFPTVLQDYNRSCTFRFACSEKAYLVDLCSRIHVELGDHGVLAELNAVAPYGGIKEPPILCNLIDAIRLQGVFSDLQDKVYLGIDPRVEDFCPVKKDKIQSKLLQIYRSRFDYGRLPNLLGQRMAITFGHGFWRGLFWPITGLRSFMNA